MKWLIAMIAVITLCAAGCGRAGLPDTGARQAAREYLAAFQKQDWTGAYQMLDPAVRAKVDGGQFTTWGNGYRRRLGFAVETFEVHSCEEVGDRAIASVTLGGHKGNRQVTKNMAVGLHRVGKQWAVVLPAAEMEMAMVSSPAG